MERRAEIIIHGTVQRAGYRDFIDECAFNLDLKGSVRNLKDGTVKVVCEGEEKNIQEFLKQINIVQYPIRVEKIDVQYSKPTGEFKAFEIIREEDIVAATYERMDVAARYMREMNKNLGNKIDKLGESLGGKIDALGSKVDGLGGKIDKLEENLGSKMDKLLEKEDAAISEIRGMRSDLKSYLDYRFAVIEAEIAKIKQKIGLS